MTECTAYFTPFYHLFALIHMCVHTYTHTHTYTNTPARAHLNTCAYKYTDLSNTMVTATGSLSGTSVTWMAVMATMIGLMLVCFLGLCIGLVLYANRLSRHGHQTIVTPRECRSPTTDRLRGSNQMQPHAASMEM